MLAARTTKYKRTETKHTPKNKEEQGEKSRAPSSRTSSSVLLITLSYCCYCCCCEAQCNVHQVRHTAVHMIRTRSYLPRTANWSRGTPAPYQHDTCTCILGLTCLEGREKAPESEQAARSAFIAVGGWVGIGASGRGSEKPRFLLRAKIRCKREGFRGTLFKSWHQPSSTAAAVRTATATAPCSIDERAGLADQSSSLARPQYTCELASIRAPGVGGLGLRSERHHHLQQLFPILPFWCYAVFHVQFKTREERGGLSGKKKSCAERISGCTRPLISGRPSWRRAYPRLAACIEGGGRDPRMHGTTRGTTSLKPPEPVLAGCFCGDFSLRGWLGL